MRALLWLAILAASTPEIARAEPRPLRYDLKRDAAVTVAASLLAFGFAAPPLEPRTCRVCAPDALDAKLRERLVWSDPRAARLDSDLLANAILPVAVLANSALSARSEGAPSEAAVDALVIGQAVSVAAALNEIAKDLVARRRPEGGNTSFYSGHTSFAFALAASAGTVSSMRGYRSAPWVWAGGMTLATGVAYLRVAGDAHWATDVVAGAAMGGLVGFAIPWFFHRADGSHARSFDLVAAPGGIALVF